MIQKLIDAYGLEREMYRKCIDTDEEIGKGRAKWDSGLWIRYKVFEEAITLAPRVEAEHVRHGRWIFYERREPQHDISGVKTWGIAYRCSECGFVHSVIEDFGHYKFCPSCGAKMDEVM